MKTLAQSILTALLLSTATFASTPDITPTASANSTVTTNSYKVAVFPSSAMPVKLNVFVERQPGLSMTVYLKDGNGSILATQYVDKKEGTFRFRFDMSELEDGNYRVEIISGNDMTRYPVTLKTQSVETTRTITLK